MQFAESMGDQFFGLRVARGLEAEVLFGEPLEGAADLLLVAA